MPLADGSLLEAETYASEERSVLVAGVGDVVLEGVDHPDVGTDTEVDLAEFKSGRGVQTHVEALVDAGLEGIDLARGRETIGEVGASFDRYSEVLAERYADTEVNGYADVVETVAIFRDVLEAFLAERHPRGEVDARGAPALGRKEGVEEKRKRFASSEERDQHKNHPQGKHWNTSTSFNNDPNPLML